LLVADSVGDGITKELFSTLGVKVGVSTKLVVEIETGLAIRVLVGSTLGPVDAG
jgi:hypothetical protein